MTEPTTSVPRSCAPRCLPLLGLALLVLLGLGGLGFFGWCWGYWGRGNALFQALWQCQCPAASEAARYPAFTVLVSACDAPVLLDLSPSGRFTLVYRERPQRQTVRLDLTTGQQRVVQQQRANVRFLTDDLVLVRPPTRQPTDYTLYDLAQQRLTHIPARALPTPPGEPLILDAATLHLARQAALVLVLPTSATVILPADYHQQPEDALVLYATADSMIRDKVKQVFTAAGIPYQDRTTSRLGTSETMPGHGQVLLRPDQQRWVDALGVYAAPDGQLLRSTQQEGFPPLRQMRPYSWVREGNAVLFVRSVATHLIYDPGFVSLVPIPQPILLLEVRE